MAKIHVSPGAYFQTIDLSAYIPRLTNCSYGVVGAFEKGPIDPVVVSDPQTFIDTFGTPDVGMYSALSALLYLEDGNQLYVKRLVGTASTRAYAEIPAGDIVTNEAVVTANGSDYQFHLSVNHAPIPGTLVLNIGNNVFYDNGSGKMLGGATSLYCNYIDYDSGAYRFTLVDAPDDGAPIELRFNGTLLVITDETLKAKTDGSSAYTGRLQRTGLYIPSGGDFDGSKIKVRIGDITLVGTEVEDDGTVNLTVEEGSTLEHKGVIDGNTGEITLSFDANDTPASGTSVVVDYFTYSEKVVQVAEGDGETRSFMGYISQRVSPGTCSIWVNDELISEDLKSGDFIGENLLYSDNTIDYTTGNIKLALTFQPDEGTVITSTYSTKAETILAIVDNDTKKSFTGQIDSTPVIKGSVEVVMDETVFYDDGLGNLINEDGVGTGTVDYETGVVKINVVELPEYGTPVRCLYLTKYGNMYAHYHGEYGNGFTGKFSYLPDTGYTFELWTQDQDPSSDSPDEFWHELDFTDTTSRSYVTNKISSYHVTIVPNANAAGNLEPLLGQYIVTADGESDLDNVTEEEAVEGIKAFSNPEQYDVNILACPDFAGNKKVMNALISVSETRGDCIAVVDTPQGLTPRQAVDWSNAESSWNQTTKYNSSFGAIYYPWLIVANPVSGSTELVPPSVVIPSMYTYTDNAAASWYAPAGVNRGKLTRATGLERTLTLEERELLYGYPNVVNPIIDIPGQGIVVWGQKTTQRQSTSLDRVNVRRLMNYIAKVLSTAFMELVFEPNDHITRTKYTQIVEPILDEIQANRGLYSCSVQCDESLNPASVIEQNEMYARITLQPMKTAEVIETTFVLNSTGASTTDSE